MHSIRKKKQQQIDNFIIPNNVLNHEEHMKSQVHYSLFDFYGHQLFVNFRDWKNPV